LQVEQCRRLGNIVVFGHIRAAARHPNEELQMAYVTNMRAACRRHYADGVKLFEDRRFDNAGYHFGFAAECAVKQRLLDCGVQQEDDAVWKHWPASRFERTEFHG
jgi:hypothetical protein